jgi:hypothetical protein
MDPFYQIATTGIAIPEEAVAGVSGFRLLRVTGTGSCICLAFEDTHGWSHLSTHMCYVTI